MVNVRFIAQQHPLFRKRKLHSNLLIVAESTFLRRGRSEELLKLKNPDQGTNPGDLHLLYIPLAVPSNCAEAQLYYSGFVNGMQAVALRFKGVVRKSSACRPIL